MKRAFMVALFLVGCGGTTSMPDGGSGALKFGDTCAADADCESNKCFMGGMRSYCSMPCTVATQATDCPVPPTTGQCNMQGFCKS